MLKLGELDTKSYYIVRQLVRDPRSSDNEISRKTGIPLRTVNRKRKELEEKGLISYFTYLHAFKDGLNHFHARSLVTIKLRLGITKSMLSNFLESSEQMILFNSKHVFESHIGESSGYVVMVMIIESMKHEDIVEILNAETVPNLNQAFGRDAVIDMSVIELTSSVRLLHNYLPARNMEKGRIKKDWDNKYIYIT